MLLVRSIDTIRVAELTLQVVVLVSLVATDAVPVRPLQVGVDIHLDDAVPECFFDLGR